MIQEFDLHIHSSRSDGQYSVSELIEIIKKNNIKMFSVTDHDNTDSIEDVRNCDLSGLKYIPGVEISSILDDKYRMHILGYYVSNECRELAEVLQQIKNNRVKRFYEIAELLEKMFDIRLEKEELDEMRFQHSIPGRPHLAALMIKHGYCETVKEAFFKYMRKVKVKTPYRIDACEAVNAIRKAGGIAVWAHPKTTEKTHDIAAEKLMTKMIDIGIRGVEIYNSIHTYDECMRYREMAEKYGLLISGGSDYHGEKVKNDVYMGVMYKGEENIKIKADDMTIVK